MALNYGRTRQTDDESGVKTMFIRISDVILDLERQRASAGGSDLPLSPRLFATLRALAGRPGVLVTRDELMRIVWPGTHVEANSVSQAIAGVRRALAGTSAGARIRTVPGRGYVLDAPVQILGPSPRRGRLRGVRRWAALAAACLALLVAGAGEQAARHASSPAPEPAWLLEARSLITTRGASEMRRAETLLERGLARASDDARAWTSLAETRYLLGFYGLAPMAGATRGAADAATRALALDPAGARAHVVRASVALDTSWDLAASARDFRAALALAPDDALVQHWLAWWCLAAARMPEARAAVDRAVALEPLSSAALTARATFAYLDGDYPAALIDAARVMDMDPGFFRAHLRDGLARLALGDRVASLASLERAYVLAPDVPEVLAALAHARAVSGDREGAERLLANPRARLAPYDEAIILTGLGRPVAAIARLEDARRAGTLTPGLFATEPRLAPLRSAPAFRRLTADESTELHVPTLLTFQPNPPT